MKKVITVEPDTYEVIVYSTTSEPAYSNEVRNVTRSIKGRIVEEFPDYNVLNVELWDGTIIEYAP